MAHTSQPGLVDSGGIVGGKSGLVATHHMKIW
jgi:hypothetical protein